MRYGVIADVHGNLHALEAAVAFLEAESVDAYLCTGDLVGYGPLPNECVRRVLALDGLCVAGNHDLMALGRLGDERCIPLARETLRWTRGVLDADARAGLAGLPLRARTGEIAIAHGSLDDAGRYVTSEAAARGCLADLPSGAVLLVLGHTHHPMAVSDRRGMVLRDATGSVDLPPGERVLLNPGAVGQSRTADPRARVMVLDTARRTAAFHALPYDVDACRRALRQRGLPAGACHLPPSRWRDAASAVTRALKRQTAVGDRASGAKT
jgi:predicted phosphodiesterase